MARREPPLSSRLQGFGTTIFAEMSALAVRTGAINLGQGFWQLGFDDGVDLCRTMLERCGVVAVPSAAFYVHPEHGRHLVPFGFCKRHDVLATWLGAQAVARGVWICGSVPERAPGADRPSNTFVLAGPAGQRHRYRKRHPFTHAGESEHYDAGEETITVDLDGVRTTPAVCYDLRFADQFWECARDTDCYVVVANWPAVRRAHWRTLVQARAIDNQAYVVGVNRVGLAGDGLEHAGDTLVVDPMGVVLADAGDTEGFVLADIDPGVVAETRARLPFMADRR